MALTAREPEGSFDDPEYVESGSLGVILSEQPDLVDDATTRRRDDATTRRPTTERPGTYAKRALSHWEHGTLEEPSERCRVVVGRTE